MINRFDEQLSSMTYLTDGCYHFTWGFVSSVCYSQRQQLSITKFNQVFAYDKVINF